MPCTVQGLLSGNSSVDCEYILLPGQKPRLQKVDNMEFKECGKPCFPTKLPRDCLASGCYCKDDYRLNLTTGLCSNEKCGFEVPPGPPLNLSEHIMHNVYTQYMFNLRGPCLAYRSLSIGDLLITFSNSIFKSTIVFILSRTGTFMQMLYFDYIIDSYLLFTYA